MKGTAKVTRGYELKLLKGGERQGTGVKGTARVSRGYGLQALKGGELQGYWGEVNYNGRGAGGERGS